MADVELAVQQIVAAGITPTYTGSLSISNTYHVRNTGRIFLHFKKSGAGSCDVTIATPRTVDGLAIADRVVQVPATTGDKMIGPFKPDVYNSQGGVDLTFTLSEITGLTVAVLRL